MEKRKSDRRMCGRMDGRTDRQTDIKPEIVVSMLKLNIVKIQLEVDILLLQGRPRLPTTSKGNRLVI